MFRKIPYPQFPVSTSFVDNYSVYFNFLTDEAKRKAQENIDINRHEKQQQERKKNLEKNDAAIIIQSRVYIQKTLFLQLPYLHVTHVQPNPCRFSRLYHPQTFRLRTGGAFQEDLEQLRQHLRRPQGVVTGRIEA